MTKSRLLGAAWLLVLGGVLAAVALVTLALRGHPASSNSASPAVVAPVGAALGGGQQAQGTSTSTTTHDMAPVQHVITAGPLAPAQAPVSQPGNGGGSVLPDPHGPPSIKPIASIAPVFADSIDGTSSGFAPANRPPVGAPGVGICSPQKNCR